MLALESWPGEMSLGFVQENLLVLLKASLAERISPNKACLWQVSLQKRLVLPGVPLRVGLSALIACFAVDSVSIPNAGLLGRNEDCFFKTQTEILRISPIPSGSFCSDSADPRLC